MASPTFSYDQDVQPYASKYFDRVAADTSLSHGAKMRLQGSLLGGLEGIETQRAKMQEERDQGRARKLSYESGVFDLENARANRARAESQLSRRAGVSGMAKEILDGDDDPETKRQKLSRAALDYADDDDALKIFGVAERALPARAKEDFTAMQVVDLTSKMANRVDPEIIPGLLQNKGALGEVLGRLAKEDLDHDRDRKLAADRTEQGFRLKDSLSEKPLKFYDPKELSKQEQDDKGNSRIHDERGKPRWLDDESTATARRMLRTLDGTPDEIEEFENLGKDSKSDRARYLLAENVRMRYQMQRAKGDAVPAASDAKAKVRTLLE